MENPIKGPSETDILLTAAEVGRETPQVDLHGLNREQAHDALEKFLNNQFMRGTRGVKIVCGKGGGVLQKLVQEILPSHPLVEAWRPATKSSAMNAVAYAVLAEKE